jgi:hypothetical protein
MSKPLLVLSIIIYAHAHSYAADKVRISMTGFAGQFMTFPLAQKRGFLKRESKKGDKSNYCSLGASCNRVAPCLAPFVLRQRV